ncbi:MAG: succinate dehydrogenase cytochrome b subunit [Flavobacteriaceae bacterium]
MAKSALLKSSLAKKYWMALTGLFLCLFLIGHLIGNLQLIYGTSLQFNQYALFMTTNPLIKVMSYLTYISIIFHAIDGIILTIQNRKARPIGYAKENAAANTRWASRNMAVLGTLILIFIVLHMTHFWAKMHFDEKIPLQKSLIESEFGPQELYHTTTGSYIGVSQVEGGQVVIKNRTDFFDAAADLKIAEGYKDLYKITVDFFQDEKAGLWFTLFYVICMGVLAFHLHHGFASAFQSLGLNHQKYNGIIKNVGTAFAIIVPLLFAIIPIYIRFFLK